MARDHMKDLRRYLVLKHIQYLVLSSPTALSTALGLLGSLYAVLALQSAKVSAKSTAVLMRSLAKADLLVPLGVAAQAAPGALGAGASPAGLPAALLRNLLTANAHISCLLLSCVAFEAYLITFFPTESRRLRTVSNARQLSRLIWTLVAAECLLFLTDDLLGGSSARGPGAWGLSACSAAAALLRSLSYYLGIALRIANVYLYYKIFFSMSNRSTLKRK